MLTLGIAMTLVITVLLGWPAAFTWALGFFCGGVVRAGWRL